MPTDFYRYEIRKSKKRRVCQVCSKVINKGAHYYYSRERKNGVFQRKTLCLEHGALARGEHERLPEEQPQGVVF